MNIAFVPIRCGSKSIPEKNIREINGKPLVYWSLKALQESKKIDQIYVALDCQKFEDVVKSFTFDKVNIFWRSEENAKDTSSTESVMLEFLESEITKFQKDDYFFLVQATSPLITSHDIDNAFELIKKKKGDSLLSCTKTKRFFWSDDGKALNYNYQKRPRRQDFDGLFMENGALYINSIKNIMKDKNRLSGDIIIYEMPEFTSIEIDEEDDWIVVEKLMQRHSREY